MKNELILVTGGARSGKSRTAEELARAGGERRFYIATAPVLDEEMRDRVTRHQAMRAADHWLTIEEETALEGALERAAAAGAESILVDCLTLWINNLMYHQQLSDEAAMARRAEALVARVRQLPCRRVVMVINEVGMGVVPESALSRRFRDCSGRCAQIVAAHADAVYLTVAGIALPIKAMRRAD